MNWATIGKQILAVLTWAKANYQVIILAIMLILVPATAWISYNKGDTSGFQRAKLEDLAVKAETVYVHQIALPQPSKPQIVHGAPARFDDVLVDSLVRAAKDSILVLYHNALLPWSYAVADTATAIINDKEFRIPTLTLIEVDNIEHVARAVVALLPFEVPMEVITRNLPVPVPPTDGEKMLYRIEGAGILATVILVVYVIVHYL
jgi:hypothetical protein